MQTESPGGYHTPLFEVALQAAATARGLPASCRRRSCRHSGQCALRHQPWNGDIDRGCCPDCAVARAAAEHVEFLLLLGRMDPEGTVYDDIAAPHLEGDPRRGNKPDPSFNSRHTRRPEAWAKAIAATFGIPGENAR